MDENTFSTSSEDTDAMDGESKVLTPTDNPLLKIDTDTGMDTFLKPTGFITKAEALLLIMTHAPVHNITDC